MKPGVGTTLEEARKRRDVDLAEVEASTKIRARYLRAIESEEWDVLPGEAYVRSFIRTYAGYLGLDGGRLLEEHGRDIDAPRADERLPQVDPSPIAGDGGRRRGRRISPWAVVAAVSAALVAILLVVVLPGGGSPATSPGRSGERPQIIRSRPKPALKPQSGVAVRLTATANVWVCLLDAGGEPLLDGRILDSGAEAGPFRSGSFTVSFGNGEVSMTVNGQQMSIPATSSPIGYRVEPGGRLHELAEGERPTCT